MMNYPLSVIELGMMDRISASVLQRFESVAQEYGLSVDVRKFRPSYACATALNAIDELFEAAEDRECYAVVRSEADVIARVYLETQLENITIS